MREFGFVEGVFSMKQPFMNRRVWINEIRIAGSTRSGY